ncbi:hypothetical protein Tco_1053391 [Tanacetum coccineum]
MRVCTANVVRDKQLILLGLSDIGQFIEDVITKKIVYHLFDDEVEFLGCVFLSYLLALEITCSCFHDFIDKDLIDLVLPDVRRIVTARTRKVTIVRVKKQFEYGSYLKLSIWGYYMFLVLGCEEDIGMKHIFVLELEVMEFENTQNNALAKLPMLKLGEYEMWEIRIKQYFQIQDYALWEVIENENSWVPIPVTTPLEETGTSTTTKMTSPATIEEKTCKKNDVKARSLLLMALPNEHQLTFDQYVDAQSMFAAIKARFGGNEATKKTQKALLKQQYENFSASSS